MKWPLLLSLAALLALDGGTAAEGQASVRAADWEAYKQRFLDPSGRIVDDANGNISHSEGQGYGLLLSVKADSRADFELIWSFTRNELLLRNDGLAAWKWDPNASPHVTDTNNATDGDMLIAYALSLAADQWQAPEFADTAAGIASTLGRTTLREHQERIILLPATVGFEAGDRPDGPVVNLSYWIFETFPRLAALAPEAHWQAAGEDGLALLREAGVGPRELPPDWLSLHTMPKPAKGFPAEFSYNAVRIPLYLVRAGVTDRDLLEPYVEGLVAEGAAATVDLRSGEPRDILSDAGYRIIPALVSCVLDGTPIPADLLTFVPTAYYPSTLQLLALSYLAEHPGACS